jgi:ParB-like chromosome segregation protein Spo0J
MTHDQNELSTFAESLQELKREVGMNPQPGEPQVLPIGDIRFAHLVFQPRSFEGNRGDSEDHIKTLMNAIRNKTDHLLDAVTVWWSGKRWLVIDGHHRLVAYQRLAKDKDKPVKVSTLPVEVFSGSLQQAITEATSRNSKDKLNMTHKEKLERAWKLVVMDHPNPPAMSRAEIAKATNVSERSISNMRAELARVTSSEPEKNPLELTWDEVKQGVKPPLDPEERWLEKQAADYARRLAKTFGVKLAKNPTLSARAIELYSTNLPKRLVECWREEAVAFAREVDAEEF